MDYRVLALAALCTLPFAFLAGGTTGSATVTADTPMALDGRVLVETGGNGPLGPHMVRETAQMHSGDRLIFLIRYCNQSGAALPGYDFVAPVPHGVRIVPDRAGTLRISADGGRSWSMPDSPMRVDASGKWYPADKLSPTHIRLRVNHGIAPGETGTVAYRGLLL